MFSRLSSLISLAVHHYHHFIPVLLTWIWNNFTMFVVRFRNMFHAGQNTKCTGPGMYGVTLYCKIVQIECWARFSISNGITTHNASKPGCALSVINRYNDKAISLERLIQISYNLFAFFRGGSLSWICFPALRHQLFPGKRRWLAFVVMLWTTAFVHNRMVKLCQRFNLDINKGRLPIPHLPQHDPQAVDVCTGFIYLGTKHLRCYVNRSSCQSACYVNGLFGYTNVRDPHPVVLW